MIDKQKDWTSHDVVAKIRNILKIRKIGHTGTLDPFATGLLILLVGNATKFSEKLTNLDKEYIVTSKFGIQTDTADITGKVIKSFENTINMPPAIQNHEGQLPISKKDFEAKIPDILNIKKQIPSKFSAIKIKGKRSYKMAYAGKNFDMPERNIEIKEFELLNYDFPYFTWRAVVSKGTYIRTLTEQIADLFQNIATTTELKRTRIGNFYLLDAITIDKVYFGMEVNDINQIPLAPSNEEEQIKSLNYNVKNHRPVVTIGTYDGMHLGHQHLLKETVNRAKTLGAESIVITYPHHPYQVLNAPFSSIAMQKEGDSNKSQYLLTEYEKREKLIKDIGIDKIHYINFDKKLSLMTADDFIKKIIVQNFHPSHIVVGYDTHIGVNRSGNVEFIKNKESLYDYKVIEVAAINYKSSIDSFIVSSSLIRKILNEGDVDLASELLARKYSIIGKVVSNKKIGKSLGFPTINLKPSDNHKLIPKSGVYFTYTSIDNVKYFGATNIGVAPTLKKENKVEIETYLIDFNSDLYEKEIELYFIDRIRDEKLFESSSDLIKQIEIDVNLIKTKKETLG